MNSIPINGINLKVGMLSPFEYINNEGRILKINRKIEIEDVEFIELNKESRALCVLSV
jgi:hypothetical protein